MTDDKIFIDSNILVYLVDKDITKKEIVISLTTTKCISIPKTGFVKITVYDILGKEIKNLVNENLNAGYYKADFNGNNLPS